MENQVKVWKSKDISGQRFWYVTALKPVKKRTYNREVVWLFRCDCGKEFEDVPGDIKRGHKKSCGCMSNFLKSEANKKAEGESAFNILFGAYKQKARERDLPFKLTELEFRNLTKGNCYYCGKPPSTNFTRKGMNGGYLYNGVDRLNNSLGYLIGNVVSCCGRCNISKLDLTEEEFLEMVRLIYEYRGLDESG